MEAKTNARQEKTRKDATKPATRDEMYCAVESILGTSEANLVRIPSAQRAASFLSSDRKQSFVHKTTGRETPFGNFEAVKLSDLMGHVNSLTTTGAVAKAKPCTPPLTTASGIDIGELQGTLKTEDKAMVQVASNFNCLENGSVHSAPDSGYLVDGAWRDCTQGPAASFGPLSAYLYRAHFVPTADTTIGQTEQSFVNLLRHVSQYFGVPVNGKLQLQGTEEGISKIDDVAKEICIGLHTDCPVMFGRQKGGVFSFFHNNIPTTDSSDHCYTYPMVDQVFTASINLGYYGKMSRECLAAGNGNRREAENIMVRTLLRASYESTYLAAIIQQRKMLFLTLVGGGSFGNPISIVVEEMERAHKLWAGHPASQLEKVQLCLFSKKDEHEVKKCLGQKQKWFWGR